MASSASYGDCVSSLRSSLKFLESSVETLDEGVSDFPRLVNVLKSVRVRLLLCVVFSLVHDGFPRAGWDVRVSCPGFVSLDRVFSLAQLWDRPPPYPPVAAAYSHLFTLSHVSVLLRCSILILLRSILSLHSPPPGHNQPANKSPQHYELVPQPTLAAAEASLRDEIGPYIAFLLSRADAQTERQERRIETLKARCDLQQGRIAKPDASAGAASKQRKSRLLSSEDKLRARVIRQRKEALRYGVERLELEVLQKERELRKRLDG